MSDSFEFTLHSPLSKEDWDKLTDVELEKTEHIWFETPSGKKVDYISAKVIDKIKAEINRQEKWLLQAGYTTYNVDIAFDAIKSLLAESEG